MNITYISDCTTQQQISCIDLSNLLSKFLIFTHIPYNSHSDMFDLFQVIVICDLNHTIHFQH